MSNLPFYLPNELRKMGFAELGKNVIIKRNVQIYHSENISLGDNVIIDDFSLIAAQAGIRIGRNVHINAYCALFGKYGIEMDDFSGLSCRVTLYTESDDYTGVSLTNPTIPVEYKPRYHTGRIRIGRHGIIGAGTTILPGVTIGEGAAVGAHSLVTKDCKPWMMYFGSPAKELKPRNQKLLELEKQLLEAEEQSLLEGEQSAAADWMEALKLFSFFEAGLRRRVWRLRGELVRCYLRMHGCSAGKGLVCRGWPYFRAVPVNNISLGDGVTIGTNVTLEVGSNGRLMIGNGVNLTQDIFIGSQLEIEIGDGTGIAERVSIRDSDHGMASDVPMREQPFLSEPIRIGADVQVGIGCLILRGAIVEDGAVLGANVIVTRSQTIKSRGIYLGSPPKMIGRRT